MSDEEKKAIENLKIEYEKLMKEDNILFPLYKSEAKRLINLIENQQKDIENWKKYCDEQNNDIILKNNKICDLEFKIEKQSKEIEELKEKNKTLKNLQNDTNRLYTEMIERKNYFERELQKLEDKIKAKIEEYEKQIEKMEKEDIGVGFTLGKEWSDLKAKVEFGQSLLEKE